MIVQHRTNALPDNQVSKPIIFVHVNEACMIYVTGHSSVILRLLFFVAFRMTDLDMAASLES